jgi:hypothetical protein
VIQEISEPPPPVVDSEPVAQEEMDNEKLVVEVELNGEINVEDTPTAVVPSESNGLLKVDGIFSTADVEDVEEGIRAIVVYNEWVSPTMTGRRPLARYQVMNNQADQKLLLVVIDLSNFVFSLETYRSVLSGFGMKCTISCSMRREQLCCIQGVVFQRSSLIQNELC